MAIRTVNLALTRQFYLDRDPEKNTPGGTLFSCRAIDSFIHARINDKLTQYMNAEETMDRSVIMTAFNEASIERARFGLTGWKNLKDSNGADVAFKSSEIEVFGHKYSVVDDDVLRSLDLQDIVDISRKIARFNELSESDVKNFA
jgi:hypothetical protein